MKIMLPVFLQFLHQKTSQFPPGSNSSHCVISGGEGLCCVRTGSSTLGWLWLTAPGWMPLVHVKSSNLCRRSVNFVFVSLSDGGYLLFYDMLLAADIMISPCFKYKYKTHLNITASFVSNYTNIHKCWVYTFYTQQKDTSTLFFTSTTMMFNNIV